jgi:protein-L-isoaspartate(D-aspartate) O-methyltransferase
MTLALTPGVSRDVMGPDIEGGVAEALGVVPRHVFLPEAQRMTAYLDRSVSLGRRRYCPRPSVVARLLDVIGSGCGSVLVVGAGTGYLAACAAQLGSHVLAVESDAELAEQARVALDTAGLSERVRVVRAVPDRAALERHPFDAIIMAGVVRRSPRHLLPGLSERGILLAPTTAESGATLLSYRRAKRGHLRRDHGPIQMEPLAFEEAQGC